MWNRIKKAITAILCGQALISASNLILVPIYLSVWTPLEYGEWLAMFALVGYFSVVDLGMNMAAVNRLTSAYARADLDGYRRTQHSAFIWYISIAGIGATVWAVIVYLFPVPSWIGVEAIAEWKGKLVIWIGGVTVLASMPCGLILNVYRTMGNVAASQWVFNAQQMMTILVTIMALIMTGDMIVVAMSQLIPLLVVSCVVIFDVKRRFPRLLPGIQCADRELFRQLVTPSLQFGLFPLSNAVVNHGSVLIVSSALGGVAVAVFSTCRTMANFAVQLTRSFNTALWPEITASEARGQIGRLRDLHRKLAIGTSTACIGLVGTLWYEGGEIIKFWTHEAINPDIVLFRLFLVLIVLQVVWHASLTVMMAANQQGKVAGYYLGGAGLGLIVAFPLTSWIGVYGIPIGLILGEILFCYHWIVQKACEVIAEEYWKYAIDVWGKCSFLFMVALGIGGIAHDVLPSFPMVRWIGVGMATLLTVGTLSWVIWLNKEEQGIILAKLGLAAQRV